VPASPKTLLGNAQQMSAQLRERRAHCGFSYSVVTEFNMDALAPLFAILAGN
jgi:hypothetical protein